MKPLNTHWVLAALLAVCFLPQGVSAKTRAVLIGVGDYLNLDADLQGPPNDVALMADMLLRRGAAAADIHALTDPGAPLPEGIGSAAPDRAAILSALDATLDQSAAGDTLLIYFSGHGSQAPDQNGDEQGGMDEIFLPRDAGRWNGAAGAVKNAILDDELAEVARRAATQGVKLVGIIDACHSATGFRALGGDTARARYIAPQYLGIPEEAGSAAGSSAPPTGDFVFLYAAQSDQRAFEYPLEGAWYGDFTRSLANVLRDVPDLSYEQLVQAVTLRLRTRSGQAAQTPVIEGPLALAPVFGGDAPALRRIAVEGTLLRAGLLQNVTAGTELALFPDPAAREPVGRARVKQVRAAEADLEILPPVPAVRVTHAEITQPGIDVSFAFSLTPDAAEVLEARVDGGVDALVASVDVPIRVGAANTIVWAGSDFALVGRDGVLDAAGPGSSPRLAAGDDPALAETLAEALTRHARRARLEQALAQLGTPSPAAFSLLKSAPDVSVAHIPGRPRGRNCRLEDFAETIGGDAKVRHCDALAVTVSNGSTKAQDVTVLYIDRDAQIDVLWPASTLSNRIPSGEQRTIRLGLRNDGPGVARETFLVLSVPAEPGSARTVLDGLAGGQMRGTQTPLTSYLTGLADPETRARGFSLTPPGGELNMSRLDLTIAPKTDNRRNTTGD